MQGHSCEKLSQYMQCSVAVNKVAGDKLVKVRPIITLCEQSFAWCFVPSQNISVDKATTRRTTIMEGMNMKSSTNSVVLPNVKPCRGTCLIITFVNNVLQFVTLFQKLQGNHNLKPPRQR